MSITRDDLRRFTVVRSLFTPTTLQRAMNRLGFVQADPIRAPARAQDLILRHRVKNYHVGDLERRYHRLGIEEDFLVAYGFVTRRLEAFMHPRCDSRVPADNIALPWPRERRRRARLLLDFIQERGEVHPREVDQHFAHGSVKNYWGGNSSATTHLLDAMHYRGLLRVTRRQSGIRLYAPREQRRACDAIEARMRLDALVDAVVHLYAPLTSAGLRFFISHLRYAVPQWRGELKNALRRAMQRLAHANIDGADWYWPANEQPADCDLADVVRLLAPFDPVVKDRFRFERLWGWVYRFEAYTPAAKRVRGYYALPLLWRDRVIGWGNLSIKDGQLQSDFGYINRPPRNRGFRAALEAELERMRAFLRLAT